LRISVVIPVYGSQTLSLCLAGIRASLRQPDEMIVVDDGSPEGQKPTTDPDIRLIRLDNGPSGPAIARNRGAANATGDVLVFIDADVVVHPDALGIIQNVFDEAPELGAVFGSYDDLAEGGTVSTFKNLLHHHVHQKARSEAETFWAGLGAVRREAFHRIGGFDETFRRPSVEDIDLGMRLVGAGYRIRLAPQILGTHLKQWTLVSWLKTDLLDRAIPWARLAARSGRMPNDLNAGLAGRLSATAVWGGIVAAFILHRPWSLIGLAAGLLFAIACHHSLIRLFYRKGGVYRAMVQTGLFVFYLFYASLVFISSFAYFKIIPRPSSETR
jgi:GT2 family glycosyltransferase